MKFRNILGEDVAEGRASHSLLKMLIAYHMSKRIRIWREKIHLKGDILLWFQPIWMAASTQGP